MVRWSWHKKRKKKNRVVDPHETNAIENMLPQTTIKDEKWMRHPNLLSMFFRGRLRLKKSRIRCHHVILWRGIVTR